MLLFLLSALLATILPATGICPNQENIAPCTCKNMGDDPMMMCSNITSAEELIGPIKGTETFKMFSLVVINSALLYIPGTVFANTVFERIRFANSQIMSLSDGDLAFVGLEDHLEEIRASDARYITQWDWSQLKNLRRLKLIDIVDIAMYSVDQEMPALKSLTSLGISKAEISFVHPSAFSKLENLFRLSLANNEITEMSRTMLPDPAPELFVIDLSGNKLESLPNDMFTNMPNLKEVEINNNKLITLNEETFQWLFENLQLLMLAGNEIRCDCRLKWMVSIRKPFYFKGECSQPEHVKGVSLKNLNQKVLVC
ncbi:unnamed protein product [Larinioides sclopetarius]|uniref:Uncharacterized protein n=1 Tax=Larinioides sclopetarius TaxID=280406 RepID=A0AAV2AYL0_9ARAC